ncbi:MAG: hypothetical protein EP329_16620, partial [Deltaproteobacteria bacterium]
MGPFSIVMSTCPSLRARILVLGLLGSITALPLGCGDYEAQVPPSPVEDVASVRDTLRVDTSAEDTASTLACPAEQGLRACPGDGACAPLDGCCEDGECEAPDTCGGAGAAHVC